MQSNLETQRLQQRKRAKPRRLGEMIVAQKQTVGLAKGGQPYQKSTGSRSAPVDAPATLAEAGIDKKLSARAQKIAAVLEDRSQEKHRPSNCGISSEIGKPSRREPNS